MTLTTAQQVATTFGDLPLHAQFLLVRDGEVDPTGNGPCEKIAEATARRLRDELEFSILWVPDPRNGNESAHPWYEAPVKQLVAA